MFTIALVEYSPKKHSKRDLKGQKELPFVPELCMIKDVIIHKSASVNLRFKAIR